MSQCNSASFFQDGKQVDIPAEDLMAVAKPYHVVDGYDFLAYPNRDTKPFRELYKIPEAKTVIRGSLRYDGNPQLTRALLKTGWLDAQPKSWLVDGITWAEATAKAIENQYLYGDNEFTVSKEIEKYDVRTINEGLRLIYNELEEGGYYHKEGYAYSANE